MSRWVFVGVAASLLGGCASLQVMSHVPVATMSRLSSLTMSEIDPKHLRVAARLPAILSPQPHGVKVKLGLEDQKGRSRTEDFELDPVSEPSEVTALAAYQRSGAPFLIFRLSAADVSRLNHIITDATGPSATTGVTIAAGVDACHRHPLGSAPLPTTTLLRTNTSGYFVLAEELDLRSLVSELDIATKVPPCAP